MAQDFSVVYAYPSVGSTSSNISGRAQSFAAYTGVYIANTGQYYIPPINQIELLKLLDANGHHKRAMNYLRDSTLEFFDDANPIFTYKMLEDLCGEIEATGNGYLRWIRNIAGVIIGAEYIPAAVTVSLLEPNRFGIFENGRLTKFEPGEIFHFKIRDYLQNIYGKPRWYEGGTAALLGEDALLAVRKALNGEGQTNEKLIATSGLEKEERERFDKNMADTKTSAGKTITMHYPKNIKLQDVLMVNRPDNFLKTDFDKFYQLSVDTINEINGIPPEVMGQRSDVAGGNVELEKLQKMAFRTLVKPRQRFLTMVNRYLPPPYQIRFNNPASYEAIDPVAVVKA